MAFFGYNGVGGTGNNSSGFIRATQQTIPQDGVLQAIWVYASAAAHTYGYDNQVQGVIYQGATLIAQGSLLVVGVADWYKLLMPPTKLTSGVEYTIGVYGDGGSFIQAVFYFHTASGKTSRNKNTGTAPNGTNAPNPISWGADSANTEYSIYAVYEAPDNFFAFF